MWNWARLPAPLQEDFSDARHRQGHAHRAGAKVARTCENRYHHALRHGEPEQRQGVTPKLLGMKLGDLCRIRYGKDHKGLRAGTIPVYGSGGIIRNVDSALSEKPSVLIPRKGTLGNLFYVDTPFWTVDTLFWTEVDSTRILPRFLYYQLKTKDLSSLNVGTAVPSLTIEVLNEIDINVPPLEVQERIVTVLASIENIVTLNNHTNDYLAA